MHAESLSILQEILAKHDIEWQVVLDIKDNVFLHLRPY